MVQHERKYISIVSSFFSKKNLLQHAIYAQVNVL